MGSQKTDLFNLQQLSHTVILQGPKKGISGQIGLGTTMLRVNQGLGNLLVVEYMLTMCEARCSIPSTPTSKKGKLGE
jgi:hypothetical protein